MDTPTTQPKNNTKPASKKRNFNERRPRPRQERPKSEYDQKTVAVRRVTRVVAGGRRFSFSVTLIIGNKKGAVGVGVGKASDTALAIEKANRAAKKSLLTLKLTPEMSLPHEVSAKYKSAQVTLMPNKGRGVVAGSAVRTIVELAGIKNVTAKVHSRSKDQLNLARATIKALSVFGTEPKKSEKKEEVAEEKK